MSKIHSTCYMCTSNCPITVETDGTELRILEMPDCVRGHAMLEHRDNAQRIVHPQMRAKWSDQWQRASWEQTFDHVAGKLLDLRDRHGAQSVCFAVGYTKEVRPYLQRLAYAFGSPHYITESSCCFASGYVAATVTLGEEYGYYLAPSRGNRPETRCRLVWSNNPEASQLPYEDHFLLKGRADCALIAVDPRRTSLARKANIHLQARPGTDGALALGLAHVIFAENLEDKVFLEKYAHGLAEYKRYIGEFTPDTVARITGIDQNTVISAARLYATSKPAQIVISPNATTHHSNGFQNHRAILLLSAITGNLDVTGGNRPWGYRFKEQSISLHDERLRELGMPMGGERFPLFVEHYPEAQGMVLADAIESGEVKAIVSIGMNRMMWQNSKRLERALKSLELFTVHDYYPSPTSDAATVFFPAATHLERQALVSWGQGAVRYRPAAVMPRGEARGDTELIFQLAEKLGLKTQFWNGDIHASYDERLRPSALRLSDLPTSGESKSFDWPAPADHAFVREGFGTPTGKVEFVSTKLQKLGMSGLPEYKEPHWNPVSKPHIAKDYPLILTSGGRSNNYTHSQGRFLPSLREREPEPRAQLNPADAVTRGIHHGDWVEVSSPLSAIRMRAEVTDELPVGVVHCFHGWAQANVNELFPDEGLDPISGFPPFKSSLCQVKKI